MAGTLRFRRDGLRALQDQGLFAEGVADVVLSDDDRSFHFVTSTGRELAEIDLPPAPWRWCTEGRVQGATYAEEDAFFVPSKGLSYLIQEDHNASADIATDLNAQPPRLTLLAKGGVDGVNPDPTVPMLDLHFCRNGTPFDGAQVYLTVLPRAMKIPKQLPGSYVQTSGYGRGVRLQLYRNGTLLANWATAPGQPVILMAWPTQDVACVARNVIGIRLFYEVTEGVTVGNDLSFTYGVISLREG